MQPAAALVCVDRYLLTKRVMTLTTGVGIHNLDIARVVSHEPSLLLLDDEDSFRLATAAVRDNVGWLLDDEGVAAVIETCPILLTHRASDVAGAFEDFAEDAMPRLEKFGVDAAAAAAAAAPAAACPGSGGGGECDDDEKNDGCAWRHMSDEAREAAMRAAVDYAGRVAEPYLRRASVMREKRNKTNNAVAAVAAAKKPTEGGTAR